jgi:cytoskeletal protein RodZ
METENFGSVLREAREKRSISLADIAQRTKLSQSALQLLEAGQLDELPAEVFVRGFIRSYARSVGLRESEPLGLFEQALDARRRAEQALLMTPQPVEQDAMGAPVVAEDETPRRGLGVAVFVIIMLVLATITLSLFLRQPPQSGEGLSFEGSRAPAALSSGGRQLDG